MPSNVTPASGLSDRSNDVRSHTGRGVGDLMVTGGSLRCRARREQVPDQLDRILVGNGLHHCEKNESWGSGG